MGSGMENPLPGKFGEWMMDVKEASLQILHLQPCVWKKPLGEIGCFGMENGFPVRMEDSGGSFLFAEIRDSLGKILEESGQLPMTG